MRHKPFDVWISRLSSDAVRVQRILDEAFLRELAGETAFGTTQQTLHKYEVESTFVISEERETAFTFRVLPLNLNYAIRFNSKAGNHQRLRWTVERLPADPGARENEERKVPWQNKPAS